MTRAVRTLGRRAVTAACVALGACAPATRYHAPSSVGGYDILINRRDSLSRAIAHGLERRGYTVRAAVAGGSRATAYLLSFTQREIEPGAATWLYIRLADTRTGAIVAAVSAPLDSLGATVAARAQAIVDSLTQHAPRDVAP